MCISVGHSSMLFQVDPLFNINISLVGLSSIGYDACLAPSMGSLLGPVHMVYFLHRSELMASLIVVRTK